MKKQNTAYSLLSFLVLSTISGCGVTSHLSQSAKANTHVNSTVPSIHPSVSRNKKHPQKTDSQRAAHYVNWDKPTGGAYPDLNKYKNIWIDVSLSKQRTYIKAGKRTIYTMIVSTGLNTPGRRTPTGTYHIQTQRGLWFYAPRFNEGAEYWVSFLHHGQYLFHSVPMHRNKQVIVPVAEELGHPASHGCVHLSLADAKWFYYHIQTGTKVVIQK